MRSSVKCKECGNDIWDVCGDVARCSNCNWERPYHKRQRGTEITPSQQKAVERIKAYFDGSRYSRSGEPTTEVEKLETEMTDFGHLAVSIKTGKSIWTEDGGYFFIGRRGGIQLLHTYALGSKTYPREEREQHIAKALGAKVAR